MLTSNTLQVNWGNGAPLNNHGILIRVDKTTIHKNIKKIVLLIMRNRIAFTGGAADKSYIY